MAEVIITEFRAEVGQFVARIDEAEASVLGLDRAEKDAQRSTAALSRQLGSSAAKAEVHRRAMEGISGSTSRVGVEAQRAGRSIDDLRKRLEQLTKRRGMLVDPKEIARANDSIRSLQMEIKSLESSTVGASGGVSGLGSKIGDVAQQAVPAVGGIGGSFLRLLGPVGLAVGAIGGAFLSIFRNTDAGATAIDGLGKGIGYTFDRITGAAKRFGDSLKGLFTDSDGEANAFIATLSTIGQKFTGLLTLGISGALRESFEADAAAGQLVAERLDELYDKRLAVNEATAKNEVTIRKNLSALRDATKPVEERLRLADEITAVEETNLRLKRDQLRAEFQILAAQAGRQRALKGEIDDELKARLSGIRVAIFDLEADSVSLTERVASRRAGIVEQEESRKKAALEKSAADAAKVRAKALADEQRAAAARARADAEEKRRASEAISAERTIEQVRATIAQAGLSDIQRRDAAVRASFEKQIDAAREAFAKLSELATTDEDRAAIAQRETAVILELAQAEAAELERLRQQDIEGVRASAMSREQIEIAAINRRFDAQRAEAERVIQLEEERTAILLALEEKRRAELAEIRTEAQAQQLAQQQAQFDAEINAIGGFAQAATALISDMARGQEDAARNFSRAALAIALDAINAMVPIWVAQATGASLAQPDSVATFGASGIARAAVLTALIKGVLAGLRSTLGFADGGEVKRGSGLAVRRSNGDNVLATLQDREIVLSRASRARAERMFGRGLWGDLGVPGFGGSIDWSAALARVAASNGPRDGGAAMLVQGRDDRRIIGALGGVGSLREQRRQTELLEELARTRGRNPRARWA